MKLLALFALRQIKCPIVLLEVLSRLAMRCNTPGPPSGQFSTTAIYPIGGASGYLETRECSVQIDRCYCEIRWF